MFLFIFFYLFFETSCINAFILFMFAFLFCCCIITYNFFSKLFLLLDLLNSLNPNFLHVCFAAVATFIHGCPLCLTLNAFGTLSKLVEGQFLVLLQYFVNKFTKNNICVLIVIFAN